MSISSEQLIKMAANFEELANDSLVATAEKKDKKKLDPKAKVRNRGNVCVPAESAKDKKDHFPINDEGQARNALARVHQYSSVPEWYSGSLKGLQALVSRKVKAKYPKIDVGGKDSKKKKSSYYDNLLGKFGAPPTKLDQAFYDDPPPSQQGQLPFVDLNKKPGTNPNNTFPNLQQYLQPPTNAPQSGGFSPNPNVGTNQPLMTQGPVTTPTPAASTQNTPAVAAKPLPVRDDVRAAQNQLYRANPNFAERLEQVGGVDGKLGKVTIQLLREYLPFYETEDAVKYLADEEKKEHAPKQQAPQEASKKPQLDTEDPWKAQQTWSGKTSSLKRVNSLLTRYAEAIEQLQEDSVNLLK